MMRVIIHGYGRSGTTIIQRIINSCKDIWVTNEFLLYDMPFGYVIHSGRDISSPKTYFESLLIKDPWNITYEHRVDYPNSLNNKTFVSKCVESLGEDTIKNRINTVENVLYSNFDKFGDKVLTPKVLKNLIEVGLTYKLIYVTRDGRSAALSQTGYGFPKLDKENSEIWADSAKFVCSLKNNLSDNFLQVKFEDFINKPEEILSSIADFLKLDLRILKTSYDQKFNSNKVRKYDFSKIKVTKHLLEALDLLGYSD